MVQYKIGGLVLIKEIFEKYVEIKCKQCTKDRECSVHIVTDGNGKKGARCGDQEYFGGGNDGK